MPPKQSGLTRLRLHPLATRWKQVPAPARVILVHRRPVSVVLPALEPELEPEPVLEPGPTRQSQAEQGLQVVRRPGREWCRGLQCNGSTRVQDRPCSPVHHACD